MSRLACIACGLLALGAILGAHFCVFATIPFVGSLHITETAWGGGGRLWLAASLVSIAILCNIRQRPEKITILLGGICLGILLDLDLSGWVWRAERLALVTELGGSNVARLIQWRTGSSCLVAANIFVLALSVIPFYIKKRI